METDIIVKTKKKTNKSKPKNICNILQIISNDKQLKKNYVFDIKAILIEVLWQAMEIIQHTLTLKKKIKT